MTGSAFRNPSEISRQKRKNLEEAAGQRLMATGIAAAFAASVAILVCPVGGALAAPAAAQVEVVNPATNPAPTSSVDDPGRTAYEARLNCSPIFQNFGCVYNFAAVPAGSRLVVQHISAGLFFSGSPTFVQVGISGSANSGFSGFLAPIAGIRSFFDQSVLQYFEAGSQPSVFIESDKVFNLISNAQPVTLTGYLLKCSAATPCAPIAP
jgi:hypothetical protein